MKKLSLLLIITLLSACSTLKSHIGVIVPEGTTFNTSQIDNAAVQKNVSGSDSAPIFLFFPLGFPNFNTAINNTLEKGKGDILTNVNITDITRWYVLFGYQEIIINADVINTKN